MKCKVCGGSIFEQSQIGLAPGLAWIHLCVPAPSANESAWVNEPQPEGKRVREPLKVIADKTN